MAKVTVGTRVPRAIAEQVKRYAETHDITRTEAIRLFLEEGLRRGGEWKVGEAKSRAYTVRIRPGARPADYGKYGAGMTDWVYQVKFSSHAAGDYSSTDALTARLPGELAAEIEAYAEDSGVSKTAAGRELLISGLKTDPLPESNPDPLPNEGDWGQAETETVTLGPLSAELFRRTRLYNCWGPSEAASELAAACHGDTEVEQGFSGLLEKE